MGAALREPSERIIDRYAIYDPIAAGGMAVVHFGRLLGQAGFSRTVAIKRLHPQFAADPEFVAMFLDEAHLAVRVQHPNVVSPLDVVVAGDELLVVMEYVSGETLSQLLRQTPEEEGVAPAIIGSVIVDTLYGLHAAHEAVGEDGTPLNMVHRDVSPQNVIVGVDGTARVLDFGVAKAAMRSHATKEGEIKGKIAYMAPEQLKAKPLDRRADIFAAGIVLWEALAGRRLFRADDLGATVDRVLHGEITPPSAFNPRVSGELDAVVLRALERDPALRYPTAREFARAVEGATPLASASEIADWVRTAGGVRLAQRIERVAAIESRSSSRVRVKARSPLDTPLGFDSATLLPAVGADAQRTPVDSRHADEVRTVRPPGAVARAPEGELPLQRVPRVSPRLLGVGAAVLVLCGGILLLATRGSGDAAPSVSNSPSAQAPAVSAVRLAEAPASVSPLHPVPENPATPSANASAVEQSAPSKGSKPQTAAASSATAGSTLRPPAKARRPSPAPAVANCNPPYTVDDRGIRRIKAGCL
jgi:serine/threonine-protein kinase